MTVEKSLINKTFYKSLMGEKNHEEPAKFLGKMYAQEQQKDVPELAYIRYAQGEVYFHHKDYEAAIFKWEKVDNELKPWALKNIGDAHFELGWLALAEDFYQQVDPDSDVLKTEVLLQLFSLYALLDRHEEAVATIKKAVQLNPDYPNVTETARTYFEEQSDWDNAVELAVNEAIRTGAPSWFSLLENYIEQKHILRFPPNYFRPVLDKLYEVNRTRLETLSAALWVTYKQSGYYFSWLETFCDFLQAQALEESYTWHRLSPLFKKTCAELVSGKYLLREISDLMPGLLAHWVRTATQEDQLLAASLVLAWEELFPETLPERSIRSAESLLNDSQRPKNVIEACSQLFEAVLTWGKKEGILPDDDLQWKVGELFDFNHYHLMIASPTSATSRTAFGRLFLDQDQVMEVAFAENATRMAESEAADGVMRLAFPCRFSAPHFKEDGTGLDLMAAPFMLDSNHLTKEVLQDLKFCDALLFVVSSERDFDLVLQIKAYLPDLPIHFVLWNADWMDKEKALEWVETIVTEIERHFPHAEVTALSTTRDPEKLAAELFKSARAAIDTVRLEEMRPSKLLHFIKLSLRSLLDKRVEAERVMMEHIDWYEELIATLDEALNRVQELTEEKTQTVKQAFGFIKNEWHKDLLTTIPDLLKKCSELITFSMDLSQIHVFINDEMNRRLSAFIEDTALPNFRKAVEEWMEVCEEEFGDSQSQLNECGKKLNALYGEEKLALNGDFKVLEDWRRDIYRMTQGGIPLEKANILLRFTPSRLLLKSAGKLFGAVSKNKDLLINKYKQFIESKDYTETAESVANQFMQQFDLFERSLSRDIKMFFDPPSVTLTKALEEAQAEVAARRDALKDLQKNPEEFRDPLTLFELRQRQLEWLSDTPARNLVEYF
jgi:tetratricopeptide (TPR) repeat protein